MALVGIEGALHYFGGLFDLLIIYLGPQELFWRVALVEHLPQLLDFVRVVLLLQRQFMETSLTAIESNWALPS